MPPPSSSPLSDGSVAPKAAAAPANERDGALQELRRRLGLPPSSAAVADFEPIPVVPNPDGKLQHREHTEIPLVFWEAPAALRSMVCPIDQSDATLCRFLRARQYDVDKAEKMYRTFLAHRARWQLDSILEEDDPLEDLWHGVAPMCHFGYDKLGRPVMIERSGEVRLNKVMSVLGKEDFYYRHLRHMETVERRLAYAARVYGPAVTQVIIIMDLANLSFKPDRHALPLFRQTMNIDTSFYPERLGAFFIINAPWIFRSLWALVRPWLDPRTQAKFHICGSDYAATLRQYIDADMLPVEYGGTNPLAVPPFRHLPDEYVAPAYKPRHMREGLQGGPLPDPEAASV